jgi:uncharacterized protein (UPF0303 family)
MSERVTDLTSSQADAPAVIATCTAQERQYRFKEFDEEIAFEVGCAIRNTFKQQYAGKPNKGIVVHIETFTGHTLFSAVVGQAPWVGPENWCVGGWEGLIADSRLWVRAKSNIVKRFGVSSLRKGRECVSTTNRYSRADARFARMGTTATDEGLLFPEYAADGGGECFLSNPS